MCLLSKGVGLIQCYMLYQKKKKQNQSQTKKPTNTQQNKTTPEQNKTKKTSKKVALSQKEFMAPGISFSKFSFYVGILNHKFKNVYTVFRESAMHLISNVQFASNLWQVIPGNK